MTDERDLHDPALDAAWRAQSTEMPPPPLDAAILAAAHRAVKSAPEKIGPGREATRPWRWWTPLAAAAVIGVIAIGALQLLPQEPDPTKVVVSDMPSTGAKSAAPAAPQAASSSQPPHRRQPTAQSARAMTQAEPSPPKVAAPAAAQNALRSRAAPAESAPRQERAMAAPPSAAPAEAPSRLRVARGTSRRRNASGARPVSRAQRRCGACARAVTCAGGCGFGCVGR